MRCERNRIQTFSDAFLGKQWAVAGFFQSNNLEQYQCYYCGIIKKELPRICDCVWLAHYHWNPFCDFISLKKGVPQPIPLLCLICLENIRNILTFPCCHVAVCETCIVSLRNSCIICRNIVNDTCKVFL